MFTTLAFALEFSHIQATEISRYHELYVRVTLDGNVQDSPESSLDAGVHAWREPFSFAASSLSQCEIHVLAKKRKFFCCAGRYKSIRTTRLQNIGQLLDMRSTNRAIRLPLYDSTKSENGPVMGSIEFLISNTSLPSDGLNYLSVRETLSNKQDSCASSLRSPYPEALPEKLSSIDSDSEPPMSPPPRPMAPSPPPSPSVSSLFCPPNLTPLLPHDGPARFHLQSSSQLPQPSSAFSPQKSGVDRIPAYMATLRDATLHSKYVPAPAILSDPTITAASSLVDEDDDLSGLPPRGPADFGSFTPVICEPPEHITFEPDGSELLPPDTTDLSTPSFDHRIIPQISITLAKSSRDNSPSAPPSCDSDTTIRRPSVFVDTGSATQPTGVTSAHSLFPGVDELSPFSQSTVLSTTSTTNTSSSGLSPFSRTSIVESPSTATTTPAQSAVSRDHRDSLSSASGSNLRQRKERPTIDTSCVGPRGQVRKYRNGSVPPVHVPVKLRNASLDLPRPHEYEKFEPNPSMYSIAPSVSPRRVKKSGDLRCPSSQRPASRQGIAPSTRAPSIRRETLEFDEAQICLDTANLGDQEVATFLKEVDAALSAIVNGTPALAADSHAFLAVPGCTNRLVSRHQSRKPSSQQLRADLSATVRSHEKEGAARTGFSLVATSHLTPHADVIPSRITPLMHTDIIPRVFLSSQVDTMTAACSIPGSQRVSPQPSPRQELVEWISPSSFDAEERPPATRSPGLFRRE